MDLALIPLISGCLAMATVAYIVVSLLKIESGTGRMREIAAFIQEGAEAFMRREFKTIAYFIVVISVLLFLLIRWEVSLGFIVGSALSLLAAYIGMSVAVRANVRTANVARTEPERAVSVAFKGGAVTGLSIVGLSLIGLSVLFIVFGRDPSLVVGFGVGASLAALFAQLGGGIYTKGADVGADLVGKVEKRIPEDDPRNPAVIADLVGDNVGDCAGRGADLFESFSDNIIGTMILGVAFAVFYGAEAIIFPLLAQSIGVISTIVATFTVRPSRNPVAPIYTSFLATGMLNLVGFYLLMKYLMGDVRLFYCATLGLLASLIVAVIVLYYTGTGRRVTVEIAKASESGPAVNVITGIAYGMESAVIPLFLIAVVTIASYYISGGGLRGVYGIATATLGILSTTGIIMASDTFGPIADNADGIAEMSGISGEIGDALEALDSVGNVTKAVTKGYAMTTMMLTAVTILFAYLVEAAEKTGIHLENINSVIVNLTHPLTIVAVILGASMPFLFSAYAIKAVGKTANEMVKEVRRQFREIKGLMEGKTKPDYARCVDISTKNALKEMIKPTLLTLISPVIVGIAFGIWRLAAYLIAVKVVSGLLAIFMINAGGAWDNAKKYIELGNLGGKGTPTHAAAVIGDTVGDPLKDTAGPSLHILVKLQNILSITFLPVFVAYAFTG